MVCKHSEGLQVTLGSFVKEEQHQHQTHGLIHTPYYNTFGRYWRVVIRGHWLLRAWNFSTLGEFWVETSMHSPKKIGSGGFESIRKSKHAFLHFIKSGNTAILFLLHTWLRFHNLCVTFPDHPSLSKLIGFITNPETSKLSLFIGVFPIFWWSPLTEKKNIF